MKPNEHLKTMMRGRRKALTLYNEMDSDVQIFLNELARVYEKDRATAVLFMVSAKRELQRKKTPGIKA